MKAILTMEIVISGFTNHSDSCILHCLTFVIFLFGFSASNVIRKESIQSFTDNTIEIHSPSGTFSILSDEGKRQSFFKVDISVNICIFKGIF